MSPSCAGGRRSRYSAFISGIEQFDPYQELTAMQIAAFRQVFDMVDKDGGGSIDAEELFNSMKDFDCNLTIDEITEILEELDRDGNGEIDFEEFLYLMTSMSVQGKGKLASSVFFKSLIITSDMINPCCLYVFRRKQTFTLICFLRNTRNSKYLLFVARDLKLPTLLL